MALRSDPLPYPPVGGRRCIFEWNIDELAHFLFEVPTSMVLPLLPRGVYPVEPRPGVSLLDVGYVAWGAGNWEAHWPAFDEVSVLLIVQPDLSFPMPMPKYAFFALNICANYQEFLDTEPVQLHLPTFFLPIAAKLTPDPYAVEVESRGELLMRLRNTQDPMQYEEVDWLGQFFTVDEGILYMGVWKWVALSAEHQAMGDAGQLCKHAAFKDLDLEPHRTCYLQLFAKPGTGSVQRFYEPFALGPAIYDNRVG